jgi:hypothetical protein
MAHNRVVALIIERGSEFKHPLSIAEIHQKLLQAFGEDSVHITDVSSDKSYTLNPVMEIEPDRGITHMHLVEG